MHPTNEWRELDRIASELQDTCHKQAKQISELKKLLREVNEWAMPMRDAPRSAIPDWFYKIREALK